MNRFLKIVLSCSFGGGVGALVALELHPVLWWLGLIAGFLVGYLSYEFNEVVLAFKVAWMKVIQWKPNKEFWKLQLSYLWWSSVFSITVSLAFDMLGGVSLFFLSFVDTLITMETIFKSVELMGLLGFCVFTIIFYVPMFDPLFSGKENFISMYKQYNPLTTYLYYVPKYLFIGVSFIVSWIYKNGVCGIPWFVVACCKFIKEFFVLIYTDIRLLCGINAAFGALAGYFFGHAIIGALAGGIFGAINYLIIVLYCGSAPLDI